MDNNIKSHAAWELEFNAIEAIKTDDTSKFDVELRFCWRVNIIGSLAHKERVAKFVHRNRGTKLTEDQCTYLHEIIYAAVNSNMFDEV